MRVIILLLLCTVSTTLVYASTMDQQCDMWNLEDYRCPKCVKNSTSVVVCEECRVPYDRTPDGDCQLDKSKIKPVDSSRVSMAFFIAFATFAVITNSMKCTKSGRHNIILALRGNYS